MTEQTYGVNSAFDLQKHKKCFVNYLEVIIHPDGSVHYAVPSHQEYLINYICKRDSISRLELENKCPPEFHWDFMTWLCRESGCISVWNRYLHAAEMTDQQRVTLASLKAEGLYKGEFESYDEVKI